jgi:hypothetical protein
MTIRVLCEKPSDIIQKRSNDISGILCLIGRKQTWLNLLLGQ